MHSTKSLKSVPTAFPPDTHTGILYSLDCKSLNIVTFLETSLQELQKNILNHIFRILPIAEKSISHAYKDGAEIQEYRKILRHLHKDNAR